MRLTKGFIPTLKEDPSGAEVISHRIMLKGGMVRLLAAGVYSYLPFLWRCLLKAQQIIREEMDAIGGQEFLSRLSTRLICGMRRAGTPISAMTFSA